MNLPGLKGKRFSWIAIALFSLLSALFPIAAGAEEVAYMDMEGKWHRIHPTEWPTYGLIPKRGRTTLHTYGITFNVTYLDVENENGIGFDSPTEGATRRDTVNQVLVYIASILDENGTCDIEFRVSETDGSGALASGGTYFFTSPPRFDNGMAFTHITTGTDPHSGLPDIYATFDFGYNWNSDMGDPAINEVDLFSVLLHELTHGLGYLSLSDAAGNSRISSGNPGVFSVMNDLLFTGNGKDLWTAGGTFAGTSSDLTGGDGGVFYTGTQATNQYGSNPPIYAPATFALGSSLSHWNTGTILHNPVMTHAISYGAQKREYPAFEKAALKDIGYTLLTVTDWEVY